MHDSFKSDLTACQVMSDLSSGALSWNTPVSSSCLPLKVHFLLWCHEEALMNQPIEPGSVVHRLRRCQSVVCVCVCMRECVLRSNFPSLAKHKAVVCGLLPRQKPHRHPELEVNTWKPSSVCALYGPPSECMCMFRSKAWSSASHLVSRGSHTLFVSISLGSTQQEAHNTTEAIRQRNASVEAMIYEQNSVSELDIKRATNHIKNQIHHTHHLAGAHKPNALLWLLSALMRHRGDSWYYLGKHPFWLEVKCFIKATLLMSMCMSGNMWACVCMRAIHSACTVVYIS